MPVTRDTRMPIVLLVPDGMGDRPHASLGGRTPLEAAYTPNFDELARLGRSGILYPVAPGHATGSHQAHFALFGYGQRDFPGRGLIEALGEGHSTAEGEIVLRANLARTSERDGALWIDERPDPRTGEAGLGGVNLDAKIDGVRCRFVHTDALQGLLFLSAARGALSHLVSDADPLHAGTWALAVQPLEEAPDAEAAARTATVLNAWIRHSRKVLAGRDLDTMLVKWPGSRTALTPFAQRFGLTGITLGAGALYKGLAAAVGLDHEEHGTEHDPEADVRVRVEATVRLLGQGYDFVHLHTKRTDMAGHKKDPARKAEVIEAIDRALGPIVERVAAGTLVVAVTPDHQTPSAGPLYHGGGAVPLVIAGGVAGADAVTTYGESAAARGTLGTLRGIDVLPLSLDAADRSAFLADRMTGHLALGAPRGSDLLPLRVKG